MAQTAQQQAAAEQRRRAAAAAAGVAAYAGADQPQEPPDSGARTAAAAKILAALVTFLAAQRRRRAQFLAQQLATRSRSAQDIEQTIRAEDDREEEFARKAAERIARDLAVALAIPDPQLRRAAVQALMTREQRFAMQRDDAALARSVAAIDRVELRQESPQGAFWKLDPTVVEHTAGCLIMGGRFWPWAVLERVHPPRHNGCPCRLVGYGQAVAEGLLAPGAVMDVRAAIRVAAGVVMEGALVIEQADADELLQEAATVEYEDLRAALEAAGLADADDLDDLEEAFNPRQARYPKGHPKAGQWRPKLGGGFGQRPQSPAREAKKAARKASDFEELRRMAAPRQVGTTRSGDGPETPIIRGPTSTAEITAVGKKAAELADRYGTHHAYRQRIDALHEERRGLIDAKGDRIEAAGGHFEVWKKAKGAAMGTGVSATEWIDENFGTPEERARLKVIDAEVADLLVREEEARRDALVGVLEQMRPMGGKVRRGKTTNGWEERDGVRTLSPAPERQVREFDEALREVGKFFPKAWLDDTNAKGHVDFEVAGSERAWHRKIETGGGSKEAAVDELIGRGFSFVGYIGVGNGVYLSVLSDPGGVRYGVTSGGTASRLNPNDLKDVLEGSRKPERKKQVNSTIKVNAQDRHTLVHELAHRMEQVYGEENQMSGLPPLLAAMQRFLRERAGDSKTVKLADLYPGYSYEDDEKTWQDRFVDGYIGKDYAGRATEVLTMGMEMLFFPRYGRDLMPRRGQTNSKSDVEMRNFILGTLGAL